MSSNAVNRRQFLAAFAALAVPPTGPLPPVSWTCPMHPEVVDDQSGACPICRMALTPVRLELVWRCRLHRDVTGHWAVRRSICARHLAKIITAHLVICPAHPATNELI